jgi:antitoxin component YwqK of YwqJK toxin-antitoxin module
MKEKVQNITVYRLDLPPEGSDEVRTMNERIVSKTSYHPESGKIILEEQYGSSGDLEQCTEFRYDDKGFLIREVLKEADGTVMEEKSYEADEHKRIAREYLHYADGSRDTITYTYDDGGNIIKKETVDADGDTEEIEEFRYENGKLVHELKRDDSGEIIFEKQFHYKDGQLAEEESKDVIEGDAQKRVYTYNEQGHRESVMLYDAEDTPLERILLETDEKGQPVKVVEENRQKKNTLYLRYDDKGNVVFQEEYDLKGMLVNRVERDYDKDGRLMESRIEQNVPSHGINRRYRVRQEYTFG